jgi:hypothetical protein
MKRYILAEPHYIGGVLLAAGSIVTDDDLGTFKAPADDERGKYLPNGQLNPDFKPRFKAGDEVQVEAGSQLIEVDAKGSPKNKADERRLTEAGISAAPIEVAPVAPHAPNPTQPQGLPAHGTGELQPPGVYVPGDGVESDEAAEAREEQQEATQPQRRKK